MNRSAIARFACNEEGTTAIEYSLIASLVSIFIVVGVTEVGISVGDLYGKVAAAFPH